MEDASNENARCIDRRPEELVGIWFYGSFAFLASFSQEEVVAKSHRFNGIQSKSQEHVIAAFILNPTVPAKIFCQGCGPTDQPTMAIIRLGCTACPKEPRATNRSEQHRSAVQSDLSTNIIIIIMSSSSAAPQATTAARNDDATNAAATAAPPPPAAAASFTVGQLVNVQSRTWPGINQPGGVGRVTAVSTGTTSEEDAGSSSSSLLLYSVKYVLDGRHEKRIEAQYVQPHQQQSMLRDRSMLLGRCTRCGSLRRDCGSCELHQWQQQQQQRQEQQPPGRRRRRRPATPHQQHKRKVQQEDESSTADNDNNDNSSSSTDDSSKEDDDSDGSSDLDALLKENKRQFRKYKRMKARAKSFFASVNADSSSSSSSSQDEQNVAAAKRRKQQHGRRSRKNGKKTKQQEQPTSVLAESEDDGSSSTSDESVDYDDDMELQQLALSQMDRIQSSANKNRTATTIRNSSLRRLKMMRRSRRAILESSSSDDKEEEISRKVEQQQHQRRRRKAHISVVETGILEATAAAAAASNDDDDNANDDVSATKTVAKSATDSASAAAAENRAAAAAASRTIDDDPVGDNQIEDGSPNNRDHITGEDGSNEDGHDEFDFPFGGNAYDNDDDDDPMDYELGPSHLNNSDDGDFFIQPEGNAEQLPRDVQDNTAAMDYPDLTPFFDETSQKLEQDEIPLYKLKVLQLERDWRDLESKQHEGVNQQPRPESHRSRKRDLKHKTQELHDEIIRILVRARLDQCRNALRKLSSKRCYKKYKNSIAPEDALVPFVDQDVREFKLDALLQAVEDIVARLRYLCASVAKDNDEDEYADCLSREAESTNSDGWADPSDQSPSQRLFGGESQFDFPMDDQSPDNDSLEPVDLHPFATKKRKPKSNNIGQRKSKSRRKATAGARSKTQNRNKGAAASTTCSGFNASCSTRGDRSRKQRSANLESMESEGSETDSVASAFQQDARAPRAPQRKQIPTKKSAKERGVSKRHRNHTKRSNSRRNVLTSVDHFEEANVEAATTDNIESPTRSARANKAPDIETILPAFLEGGGDANDIETTTNRQSDREAISDRMQRWIDANAGDVAHPGEGETTADSLRIPLSRSERRGQRQASQEAKNGVSPQIDCLHGDTLKWARKKVYASLAQRVPALLPDVENTPSPERTLATLCSSLDEPCSTASFKKTLDEICCKANRASLEPSYEDNAPLLFQTLYTHLCRHGNPTIQELVSRDNPLLERLVAVLVALLRLIKQDANKKLSPEDGIAYEIFGGVNCFRFIDLVMVQLVEAVLSLVLPPAWGLRVKDPTRILRRLEPLRDAMALHHHLTERVCRCLSRELGKQEWRCFRNGEHVFVSSFDPDEWGSFLSTGKITATPAQSRHSAFPKPLPRCEVDALWFLLAYFGAPKSLMENSESSRWSFVSQCINQGSLYTDDQSENLPPSQKQLDAVVEDLSSLVHLIATGAMEDLPRRDNVLFDIIRRAVLLQADDIFLTEESRISCLPSIPDKSSDKKVALQIWDGLWSFRDFEGSSRDIATLLCQNDADLQWMGQPVLLPSSRILRCCLGLLVAWADRIPEGKPRRLQIFENGVKSLVKNLSNDSEAVADESSLDAFQLAFSVESTPGNGGNAEERRSLFRKESAAYITIFATLMITPKTKQASEKAGTQNLSPSLAQFRRLWTMVSDDAMMKRQEWIESNSGGLRPAEKFQGGIYQLHLASKLASILAVSLFGKSPLLGSAFSNTSGTISDSSASDYRSSAFRFFLSCLIACLDCSSDSENSPEVISRIAISIGIVLSQASRLFSADFTPAGSQELLCNRILKMLASSSALQRAFRTVTSASYCGPEEDLCLLALLGIIRRAATLMPERGTTAAALVTGVDNGEQDEFGDIDDALLASIDLGTAETRVDGNEINAVSSIYVLLVDALLESKPSARNALFQPGAHTHANAMSPQGMKLVGKRSNHICRTLVDIIASQGHFGSSMKQPWIVTNRFNPYDQGDGAYYKMIGGLITKHLCSYFRSDSILAVVSQSKEDLLFNLFESLMDVKVLQKIPSCNLSRISEKSGQCGEEKAFTQLRSYRNGPSASLRDTVHEFRTFCGNMGRLFIAVGESGVGELLMNFEGNANGEHVQLVDSVESEIFHRFLLFRDVLDLLRRTQCMSFSLEKVSSHLIATCSNALAQLLKKIGIQDQANQDDPRQSFNTARLYEHVSCFAEIFVSSVAHIFRDFGSNCSAKFAALVTNISDRFIAPLLQGCDIKLLSCLDEIALQSSDVMRSEFPARRHLQSAVCSTAFDMCPYRSLLQRCIIRRSREFLLYAAETNSPTIIDAFLAIGTEGSALSISRAFALDAYNQAIIEPDSEDRIFPLQAALEDAFGRAEETHSVATSQMNSLTKLKVMALEKILIPKLGSSFPDASKRCGVLNLLRHMLDTENEERNSLESAFVLCPLAKGIVVSIRAALQRSIVDDELVKACFGCARSLINMPAACVDTNAVGWLIDWLCSSREHGAGTADNLPSSARAAVAVEGVDGKKIVSVQYLWCLCLWLKNLGDLIVHGKLDLLHAIRDKLLETPKNDSSGFGAWVCIGTSNDETTLLQSNNLIELENSLFPEARTEGGQKIVNVYKRNNTAHTSAVSDSIIGAGAGPLVRWKPGVELRSTVAQFTAKVQSASFLS